MHTSVIPIFRLQIYNHQAYIIKWTLVVRMEFRPPSPFDTSQVDVLVGNMH